MSQPPPANPSRLHELPGQECLRLLAYRSYVGHIGFSLEGRPMILPVNYLFDEGVVIFRTSERSLLSGLEGRLVAFEVDDNTPLDSAGWSVLVHGTVERITDGTWLERMRRGPLRSWAWRRAELFFRIPIESITGRTIGE